jgi:hypothetical protein
VQASVTKKSVKAKFQSVKHLSQRRISLSLSLVKSIAGEEENDGAHPFRVRV